VTSASKERGKMGWKRYKCVNIVAPPKGIDTLQELFILKCLINSPLFSFFSKIGDQTPASETGIKEVIEL
jgi:hypothetical protein